MAYKDKRVTIKLPLDLAADIAALDLPGSLTDQAIWLLRQAVKGKGERG